MAFCNKIMSSGTEGRREKKNTTRCFAKLKHSQTESYNNVTKCAASPSEYILMMMSWWRAAVPSGSPRIRKPRSQEHRENKRDTDSNTHKRGEKIDKHSWQRAECQILENFEKSHFHFFLLSFTTAHVLDGMCCKTGNVTNVTVLPHQHFFLWTSQEVLGTWNHVRRRKGGFRSLPKDRGGQFFKYQKFKEEDCMINLRAWCHGVTTGESTAEFLFSCFRKSTEVFPL